MRKVENGDTVQINFVARLEDGTVFDQSSPYHAAAIHLGQGEIAPGVEEALIGMAPGESKTVTLGPDKAFGERDEELKISLARAQFPEEFQPETGMVIHLRTPAGEALPAMIVGFTDENVDLDLNHPLAGKTVTYDVDVAGFGEPEGCGDPHDCGGVSACASGCCGGCGLPPEEER